MTTKGIWLVGVGMVGLRMLVTAVVRQPIAPWKDEFDRAAIGVDSELIGDHVLLTDRFSDQALSQLGALARGQQPSGDIARKDIDDHVEMEVRPFLRAQQFRDVPRPDPVWTSSHQFGLDRRRMSGLLAALMHLVGGAQHTVHRRH